MPPGASSACARANRNVTVDFTPDPPVLEISDEQSTLVFPFPSIQVEGNAVTVGTSTAVATTDYEVDDINTLMLKRTKP